MKLILMVSDFESGKLIKFPDISIGIPELF